MHPRRGESPSSAAGIRGRSVSTRHSAILLWILIREDVDFPSDDSGGDAAAAAAGDGGLKVRGGERRI